MYVDEFQIHSWEKKLYKAWEVAIRSTVELQLFFFFGKIFYIY